MQKQTKIQNPLTTAMYHDIERFYVLNIGYLIVQYSDTLRNVNTGIFISYIEQKINIAKVKELCGHSLFHNQLNGRQMYDLVFGSFSANVFYN